MRAALAGGGWLMALTVGVAAYFAGGVTDPERLVPALSPAQISCPVGFASTRGVEPDSGLNFQVCESARYILTIREDGRLSGFDLEVAGFLESDAVEALLR